MNKEKLKTVLELIHGSLSVLLMLSIFGGIVWFCWAIHPLVGVFAAIILIISGIETILKDL